MSTAVTWLGHATVLLEVGGARLLTDPLLRPRVAHLRREAAAPADPGRLDAVLISHRHRDHLDLPSLRALDPEVPVVVPPGGVGGLRGRRVIELAAGEAVTLGGVEVAAVPAVHDGRRAPVGRPLEAVGFLAGGVYFAGDTERFAGMRDLDPRVALLPISGWGPNLGPGHMDPGEAARALALLEPEVAVPIHHGTFRPIVGRGPVAGHLDAFLTAAAREAPEVRVAALAPGERLELP